MSKDTNKFNWNSRSTNNINSFLLQKLESRFPKSLTFFLDGRLAMKGQCQNVEPRSCASVSGRFLSGNFLTLIYKRHAIAVSRMNNWILIAFQFCYLCLGGWYCLRIARLYAKCRPVVLILKKSFINFQMAENRKYYYEIFMIMFCVVGPFTKYWNRPL